MTVTESREESFLKKNQGETLFRLISSTFLVDV